MRARPPQANPRFTYLTPGGSQSHRLLHHRLAVGLGDDVVPLAIVNCTPAVQPGRGAGRSRRQGHPALFVDSKDVTGFVHLLNQHGVG